MQTHTCFPPPCTMAPSFPPLLPLASPTTNGLFNPILPKQTGNCRPRLSNNNTQTQSLHDAHQFSRPMATPSNSSLNLDSHLQSQYQTSCSNPTQPNPTSTQHPPNHVYSYVLLQTQSNTRISTSTIPSHLQTITKGLSNHNSHSHNTNSHGIANPTNCFKPSIEYQMHPIRVCIYASLY